MNQPNPNPNPNQPPNKTPLKAPMEPLPDLITWLATGDLNEASDEVEHTRFARLRPLALLIIQYNARAKTLHDGRRDDEVISDDEAVLHILVANLTIIAGAMFVGLQPAIELMQTIRDFTHTKAQEEKRQMMAAAIAETTDGTPITTDLATDPNTVVQDRQGKDITPDIIVQLATGFNAKYGETEAALMRAKARQN